MQEFDPAGIGARSLQECLLIQIDRREESRLKKLMRKVVTGYFEEFTHKALGNYTTRLSRSTANRPMCSFRELRKLNPQAWGLDGGDCR